MARLTSNILYDVVDINTGELVTYSAVTKWNDGTTMNDSKCDGTIYRKSGSTYFRRCIDNYESLNAKWFGATGNGVTDDSLALKTFMHTCIALKKDAFIPAGNYLCNTQSNSIALSGTNTGKVLYSDNSGVKKYRLYGEKNTKITTSLSGNFFSFYNQHQDCVVENIFFENTHPVWTSSTGSQCFYFQGLGGATANTATQAATVGIQNFTIRNCRFEGWNHAIHGAGIRGIKVENCLFQAPRGHDDATTSSAPAVFVKFYDNGTQGAVWDAKFLNNIADGWTGSGDIATNTTSKRPMDGFIIGPIYGLVYMGNTTRNFIEEHIIVSFHNNTTLGDYDTPLTFIGNHFYCNFPDNTVHYLNTAVLKKNVNAIRADAFNVEIAHNEFHHCTSPILIRPMDQVGVKGRNYRVMDNKFYSARDTTGKYAFKAMINIQGDNSSLRAERINVSNNFIDIDSIYLDELNASWAPISGVSRCAIQIYDSEKAIVDNNKIFIKNVSLNGNSFYGMIYGRIASSEEVGLIDSHNLIVGAPSGEYLITGSTITNGELADIKWVGKYNKGISTFSGNGSTTTFNIAHGLGMGIVGLIPKVTSLTPATAAARELHHISADTTNISVVFATAPTSGSPISFHWKAEL